MFNDDKELIESKNAVKEFTARKKQNRPEVNRNEPTVTADKGLESGDSESEGNLIDYFESSDDYSALSTEDYDDEHGNRRKSKYVNFEPKSEKV